MTTSGVAGQDSSCPELVLFQTEWCPASRRVRQRLTELGLDVVLRQVPVEHEARTAVLAATGSTSIPVLVADGQVIPGEDAIVAFLATRFPEPPEARAHQAKAARARARELEKACQQLAAATR
jgi:glutathione S-transferase